MADEGAKNRWIAAASVLCLGAGLWIHFGSTAATPREARPALDLPPLTRVGYAPRVSKLLDAGDVEAAQTHLEESSLLGAPALELLSRSPSITYFEATKRRDAALRKRIALAWAERFADSKRLNDAQRVALARATDNVDVLALLAPRDAKAAFAAGVVYLARGLDSGIPVEFMHATRHFRRALSVDPDHALAAEYLAVAEQRARVR